MFLPVQNKHPKDRKQGNRVPKNYRTTERRTNFEDTSRRPRLDTSSVTCSLKLDDDEFLSIFQTGQKLTFSGL